MSTNWSLNGVNLAAARSKNLLGRYLRRLENRMVYPMGSTPKTVGLGENPRGGGKVGATIGKIMGEE